MIKIENIKVYGWEEAIRGMRNPYNSWEKSDSTFNIQYVSQNEYPNEYRNSGTIIGPNDARLMKQLVIGGPVHAKYKRMITCYMDITAPFYWWKEFDTYKVGTVANSCSTMHTIHKKEFELSDFSHENLDDDGIADLEYLINSLETYREKFIMTNDRSKWDCIIQLLPTSYNQKRTIMLNYEVLSNIYFHRRKHKLNEWVEFCKAIDELPYSWIITYRDEAD